MIPLLIGLVCLVAVVRLDGHRMSGRAMAPWTLLVAVLVMAQLWAGSGRIDPYRVTLLGFRFDLESTPSEAGLTLSGDERTADVWAAGAGSAPVGFITASGAAGGATVRAAEDAGATLLVRRRGRRDAWDVLGSRGVAPGDTVVVQAGGVVARLTFTGRSDSLAVGPVRVPAPWLRQDLVRVEAIGPEGDGLSTSVPLRGVRHRGIAGMAPRKPSAFQRTYPVADVLVVAGVTESVGALGSFFFYRNGELRLADLDSEVEFAGGEAPRTASLGPDGTDLMIAGLTYRDHPDEGLTLPSRYGLRPLRAYRATSIATGLDLMLVAPEIRSLGRDWLDRSTVRSVDPAASGYRVRLSGPASSMARDDVSFRSAPASFKAAGHALLALDRDPSVREFGIVTPGGAARWELGRLLALGSGDRALLMRVDGQSTSAGFWLLHAVLFLLPVFLVGATPRRGSVLGLAVLASGFAAVRLLLAWSAHLSDPFLAEGVQLALWLVPVLPLAIVTAGDLGTWWSTRRVGRAPTQAAGTSLAPRLPRAVTPAGEPSVTKGSGALPRVGGWAALATLTVVLFPDSPGRMAVLLFAVAGLWAGSLVPRIDDARWRLPPDLGDRWLQVGPFTGFILGGALLGVRALMDLVGWREAIQVGGTRIAVSAGYTPAVLLAFAWLLVAHGVQVTGAVGGRGRRSALCGALSSLGGFLLLAVVGVSLWISDFGIALVGLPGMLLGLAVVGGRWARRSKTDSMALATALPLALFVTLQAAPSALSPLLEGNGRDAGSRMAEWNRNELLLLERGDPQGLGLIGQRRSEALAVMRETMRSYTRGNLWGRGYLEGRLTAEIRPTAPREHAVGALLASEWGLPGVAGLVLLLIALLVPAGRALGFPDAPSLQGAARWTALFLVPVIGARVLPPPWGLVAVGAGAMGLLAWAVHEVGAESDGIVSVGAPPGWARTTAALFLFGVVGAGVYMVLANYGLVFFTGKNVYLMGVDSVGDAVEGMVLLSGAALALSLHSPIQPGTPVPPPTARLSRKRTIPSIPPPREPVEVER